MMSVISIGTLLIIAIYPQARENITISFISNSVRFTEYPVAFCAIAALFIFAGILSFLILFRSKLAYYVGAFYCFVALTLLGSLTAMGVGVVNDPTTTYVFLTLIFGGLGIYFWRNRNKLKQC